MRRLALAAVLLLASLGVARASILFGSQGTATGIIFAPPSLAFGNVTVGTSSSPQTITATNKGVSTVYVTSIVISGSGDYSVTNNTCTSLAQNANCSFQVTFSPHSAGASAANVVFSTGSTLPTFDPFSPVSSATAGDLQIATQNANTFVLGSYRFANTATPTQGTGWTKISGANYQLTEYKILSATQTNLDVAVGTGANDNNGAIADALVQAAAGTLALDGSGQAHATSGNSTTVNLTTTQANDIIIVSATVNGASVSGISSPNTGTWQLRRGVTNSQGFRLEEWWSTASAALTAEPIKVQLTGNTSYDTIGAIGINGVSQ